MPRHNSAWRLRALPARRLRAYYDQLGLSGSLPSGQVGAAYSATVAGVGGTAPYSYAVTAGALPAGLALDAGTGAVTGTPTGVETAVFTVTVTDAGGRTGARSFGVPVIPFTPDALSGLALWLTASPTYCFTDGAAGFAAASSQYLSVASNASLQTGDVDFWVAGWVKLASVASDMILFGKTTGTLEYAVEFNNGVNRFQFYVSSDGGGGAGFTRVSADTFGAPSAGQWYFVLGWYSSSDHTIRISVNGGTADAALAQVGGAFAGTSPFAVGAASTPGQYTDGSLDSVAFGKPAGPIADIIDALAARLYNSGAGLVYADLTAQEKTDWGLVSWYDFNSDVTFDAHGTNTLTNNNGVTVVAGITRGAAGDGDAVSVWLDRSGAGNDLTQETVSSRPILYSLGGGLWCVTGDGVDDFMASAVLGAWGTTAGTVASRFAATATGANLSPLALVDQANGELFRYSGDGKAYARNFRATRYDAAYTPTDDTNPRTYVQVNGADYRLYENGVQKGTTQAVDWEQPHEFVTHKIQNAFSPLDLAGAVVTNTALADADRALLETYLAALYP